MEITFQSPWWLVLLGCLPVVVWQSAGSLSGLGPIRRWLAIAARGIVLALVIASLADLALVGRSDRQCILFVLDQSQSIPQERTADALMLVAGAIDERARDRDQAGLLVFGRNARIEFPPAEYPRDRRQKWRSIGSRIDPQSSDLAAGIKLALGSFPPDSARRIVLLSDGNQNRGNALAQAIASQQNSVPIDVIPIEYHYDSEVLVDKVVLPPDLKKGDTANLKVVIRSARAATGLLRLNRLREAESQTVIEQRLEGPDALQPGLNVRMVRQTIDQPDLYTYEAHFEPDPQAGDQLARNNQASTFTYIRGQGQVLLLTTKPTQFEPLVDQLRRANIEVQVREPEQLQENLTRLKRYDCVLVGDVPAEQLGEPFQKALAANTRDLGIGLVMIGGEDSFGAGGYIGSPLEDALPVEMEVPSTKIQGKGALVLIMHACEIPEGNFWQKEIAKLAVKTLGRQDECGLVYWGGQPSWLFSLQPVGDRTRMFRRIDTMTPGDMPDFDSAMRMAVDALAASKAMTRHTIIISDGDPSPPSQPVLQKFVDTKVTITTVAVASHGPAESALMRDIARSTKGRYYEVTHPKALPQIYIKETRVVSRPLIFERPTPWTPRLADDTEPVRGLVELPPIRGFVLTTPKATAEVPIVSPLPAEFETNPILAHWQFGVGRAVAFTSDAGQKWAADWIGTEPFQTLWPQLVRWAMRPNESEHLSVSMQELDGTVTTVVNAMDQAEYLNFLQLHGTLQKPDGDSQTLEFRQTAPGKYVAQFPAEQSGAYFLTIPHRQPDGSAGVVDAGINIPYPPEYRDTQSDRDLLENIAELTGGRVVEWAAAGKTNFFESNLPAVRRLQEVWPLLLLVALVTFLADVGVRRIAIDPRVVTRAARRAWARFRHQPVPETTITIERLRLKKAEVDEAISQQRFEPDLVAPAVREEALPSDVRPAPTPSQPTSKPPALAPLPAQPEEETYTSRLLRAKKQVWEDREQDQ